MQKDQTDVVEITNKVHIQRMTELLAATSMYMYVGMILWNVAIYTVVLVHVILFHFMVCHFKNSYIVTHVIAITTADWCRLLYVISNYYE